MATILWLLFEKLVEVLFMYVYAMLISKLPKKDVDGDKIIIIRKNLVYDECPVKRRPLSCLRVFVCSICYKLVTQITFDPKVAAGK